MVSQNRVRFALALGLTLGLAACSKGNSNSSPGGLSALDERPSGTFTVSGKPSSTPIESRYKSPACNPGQMNGAGGQIDSRLKVGDQIVTSIHYISRVNSVSAKAVETIQSIAQNTLVSDMDIRDIAIASGDLPSHLSFTKTCTQASDDKGQVFKCDEKPDIDVKVPSENCIVKSDKDEYSESEGSYKLPSGVEVHAYKSTQTRTGEIFCRLDDGPEVSRGHGKSVMVEIASNDLIAADESRCGGQSIFNYSVVTDDSGKVLYSGRVEVESAPLAK